MRGEADDERAPQWRRGLRLWRRDPAQELDDELRFHLESRIAEFEASGLSRAAAERAAAERFGDAAVVRLQCDALLRERARRSRRRGVLSAVRQDLKFGWRAMRRTPGFTLVAALSLALGIGANAAIFGVMHSLLFARLRIPDAQELIQLRVQRDRSASGLPARIAEMMRHQPTFFDRSDYLALRDARWLELASYTSTTIEQGEASVQLNLVDGGYFSMLRIRPLLGRLIGPQDERSDAAVVVISEMFWEKRLARDPNVLGRTIRLGDAVFTVIGVTPESYRGLQFPGNFEAAIPLTPANAQRVGAAREAMDPPVMVAGRVRGDVARAQADLNVLYGRCCTRPGQSNADRVPITLLDISRGQTHPKLDVRAQYGTMLWVLMAGVAVLLLLACANVGNLLLARARMRERELALRHSLGAGSARLVQQMLTESAQLALLGATAGLLLAKWGTNLLAANLPPNVAQFADLVRFRASPAILAFTAAVALACTFLFGILPAIRAARVDVIRPLKEGGRGGLSRAGLLDSGVVAVQVALALLLVSAGGLLVQTFRNLRDVDAGFDRTNRLLATLETRGTSYAATGIGPLHDGIMAQVSAIPGVRQAAMSSYLPQYGGNHWISSSEHDWALQRIGVTPGYFSAMGIALLRGRDFLPSDNATSERVAIVSDAFVRRAFAGRDPLGAVLRPPEFDARDDSTAVRIIGVAADVRYDDARTPPTPVVYLPTSQIEHWRYLQLIAHSPGGTTTVGEPLRRAILDAAPGVWIRRVATMEQALNEDLARERLVAALASLFAVIALALAAVGVYGVLAYQVAGRTSEIGTRMVLGARPRSLVWLVLRQSLVMVVAGFLIGVPLALAAGRALAAQLFGIEPWDPTTLASAMLSLAAAGVIAIMIPALRAVRVDPIVALRAE